MPRAVLIGEAMLELSRADAGWKLGYGGDTLNTAIHLARGGIDTAYLTALGSDPFSAQMRSAWQAEGLDCTAVLTHPSRQAGLYAITTDAEGERTFTYWRSDSAARALFDCPGIESALAAAEGADMVAYSLITLAILPAAARDAVFALCERVRARGGTVAFDGNYRPQLWSGSHEARGARDAAIACADIGLPTLEDESALSGESDAQAVAAHWRALGCGEVIVKLGAQGCLAPGGQIVPPPQVLKPIDTSGAGDAFNGGYLTARLRGSAVAEAILAGHRQAGWVVSRRGAIPPLD
ncbi:sugar kinase [Novosphingobium sp.]|uniref:sugar kinase n=1 Tax=Novosphingobium sp. TaxID=1874826 RepID=UPI0025D5E10C|nr:sugar kinase [Novosphingobium sp.]